MAIKVFLNERSLLVVSLYNSPKTSLNPSLFSRIESFGTDCIILGDLNAKLKSLGCSCDEDNGLEDILLSGNGVVINNKVPTYCKFGNANKMEVLDLCICSASCSGLIDNFTVVNTNDMGSDHFPIVAEFKYAHEKPASNFSFHKDKADWLLETAIPSTGNKIFG